MRDAPHHYRGRIAKGLDAREAGRRRVRRSAARRISLMNEPHNASQASWPGGILRWGRRKRGKLKSAKRRFAKRKGRHGNLGLIVSRASWRRERFDIQPARIPVRADFVFWSMRGLPCIDMLAATLEPHAVAQWIPTAGWRRDKTTHTFCILLALGEAMSFVVPMNVTRDAPCIWPVSIASLTTLLATWMPSTIFEAVPGSAGGVVKSSVMVFALRVDSQAGKRTPFLIVPDH
jgi:hypothetical protein